MGKEGRICCEVNDGACIFVRVIEVLYDSGVSSRSVVSPVHVGNSNIKSKSDSNTIFSA